MSQNLKINGKQYNGVSVIGAPSVNGGTARFYDTSNSTAIADDIALGKTAYINGGKIVGTSQGGGATLGTKTITSNGEYDAQDDGYDGYSSVDVQVPGSSPTLQAKTNIAPTTSSQTITPDQGYDGLSSVQIDAMPTGTAGTPTATKGTVSSHSIAVTPSVTNTTGYITGGTKTGTAVTVSASELDSGTKSISTNGTHDVVGYASANVAVPASAVDTGTKSISISSNGTTTHDVVGYASASVTANVPNSYSASDEGKVVDNGALVSQTSDTVTANDTYDTTLINSLTVNVSGGGGISVDDIATNSAPSGAITLSSGVTSIGIQAFMRKPITSISGSGVTSVGDSAFENCSSLTSVSFPALITVGTGSFRSGKYASISFPSVTTVGAYAFQSNGNTLTSISLPEATTIGNNFVYDCQKLTSVDIPKCTKINGSSFQQCYTLEFLDLPKVTQIDGNAFYNARKLATLVLRHTSVVTLSNVSAFVNTPIRGYNSGSGTIYVPNSLINSYKTASNWVTIFNEGHVTFAAIEGSQYE